MLWVLICMVHLTECSCHVTYAFQSESTLYSFLNVKELLPRNSPKISSLSDCKWTRTHNHLVCKQTHNNLWLNDWTVLWVLLYKLHLTVRSCHVTYAFQIETGAWKFLKRTLVLGDTVLTLFYAILKIWVSIKILSGTLKLSKCSMECSICIWLARNNKEWTPAANYKLNDSSKEANSSPSTSSLNKTTRPVSNKKSIWTIVLTLWNRVPLESNTLSLVLQAISLNMAVRKNSTKPFHLSNFLCSLKCKLSNIRGVPLDFNTKQDLAEILQVVLDQLKYVSLAASQLISNTQKTQVSCNTCFSYSVWEETLEIITLLVSTDIQTSINHFLKPEILSSQNKWFCPWCSVLFESTRETCIINSGPILIIQLSYSLIRVVN